MVLQSRLMDLILNFRCTGSKETQRLMMKVMMDNDDDNDMERVTRDLYIEKSNRDQFV